jgi:hypothetical protein
MPPEQALGRTAEIDARSDLFAVGATVFVLLAGVSVHSASTGSEQLVYAATRRARSLAEAIPDAPPLLAAFVDRALAFDKEDRWQSARDMQVALEGVYAALFGEPFPPDARLAPPPKCASAEAHSIATAPPHTPSSTPLGLALATTRANLGDVASEPLVATPRARGFRRVLLGAALGLLALVTWRLTPLWSAPPRASASPSTHAPEARPTLAGHYGVASRRAPEGAVDFDGALALEKTGPVYTIARRSSASHAYGGVAIEEGNLLCAGWSRGTFYGIAVYRLVGNTLRGTWAIAYAAGTGTEQLEGPPDMNGEYVITAGYSPRTHETYTGRATIRPTGETYAVRWDLDDQESFNGVGIRRGDLLVVGWSIGDAPFGVSIYDVDATGKVLDGTWATPGTPTLGVERLLRE